MFFYLFLGHFVYGESSIEVGSNGTIGSHNASDLSIQIVGVWIVLLHTLNVDPVSIELLEDGVSEIEFALEFRLLEQDIPLTIALYEFADDKSSLVRTVLHDIDWLRRGLDPRGAWLDGLEKFEVIWGHEFVTLDACPLKATTLTGYLSSLRAVDGLDRLRLRLWLWLYQSLWFVCWNDWSLRRT